MNIEIESAEGRSMYQPNYQVQPLSVIQREIYVGGDPILFESSASNKERTLSVLPPEQYLDDSRITRSNL